MKPLERRSRSRQHVRDKPRDSKLPSSSRAALFACIVFVAVSVGRLADLLPVLAPLKLGNVSALFVLLALVLTPKHKLGRLSDTKLTPPVLIFLALVGTSILFSVWRSGSLDFLESALVVNLFIFVGLVKALRNTGDLRKIAYVIILSAIGFTVRGVAGDWGERLTVDSMFDQNDLALFLCCALPFMLAEASLAKQNRTKLILIGASLCSVLMMVLTQSRGGFLALLAVTASMILFRGFRLDKKPASFRVRARRVLILAVAATFLVALAPEGARERLLTITEVASDYNVRADKDGRIAIWTRGLGYLSGHPWGSGVGTYQVIDMWQGGQFRAAHNAFVQVAVEIGVIGLIVYLWCFKRAFGTLRRVTRGLQSQKMAVRRTKTAVTLYAYSQALLLAMIAFCVAGFFLSAGYTNLLFLFFAMIAHVERLGKQYVSPTLRHSGFEQNRDAPSLV